MITLTTTDDTDALARRIAPQLRAGDVLLLHGPIGAGKTHFARALIQCFVTEDVPSPTFTLVQVYDAPDFAIWHADLYRLSHPDEIIELGLTEAFDTALCLVEWPDRLGREKPARAIDLHFEVRPDDARILRVHGAPDRLGVGND
jgi:tRNA threonylcarbamoyladenosine biosynthesis protein TsaE